jgi:hypothetical protein
VLGQGCLLLEVADELAQVGGHLSKRDPQHVCRPFGGDVLTQIAHGHGARYFSHLVLIGDHAADGIGHLAELITRTNRDLLVQVADGQTLGRRRHLAGSAGDVP